MALKAGCNVFEFSGYEKRSTYFYCFNTISGGKKHQRSRDSRLPPEPPESPPCTCDEETVAGDQVDHDPMRPLSAFGFGAPSPRSPGHSALSFGISDAYTVLKELRTFVDQGCRHF